MACSKLALPRKLGRSPGVRFARRRGLAGMAFLLTAALAHPAGAQVHRCDGGQIVKDNPSFDYCSAFRQYLKPEQGVIDRKLETILKNDGSLKGKLRSYAFLVSVSKYPNLQNPDDQVIKGVGCRARHHRRLSEGARLRRNCRLDRKSRRLTRISTIFFRIIS